MGVVPPLVNKTVDKITKGYPAAEKTYATIEEYAKDTSKTIMVEAFVPWNWALKNVVLGAHITMTYTKYKSINPNIIVLNEVELPEIMEGDRPSDLYLAFCKNYKEVRNFYSYFYKNDGPVEFDGLTWRKVYTDVNGVAIWESDR